MKSFQNVAPIFAAGLLITACASPDAAPTDEPSAEETAAQQSEIVENAIRRAYEDEGAEVTEIVMELNPDGSRYLGRATVRDTATGTEIDVDCRYYSDVTGAPQLNCDRVTDEE